MEEQAHLEILFWGNYIPLQGAQYIVGAADLLRHENLKFTMIGWGQMYEDVRVAAKNKEVKNITFIERLPLDHLPGLITKADICLGIFGDTEKTGMVIPNKAYEAIAMGKPLISADTPAIRELFTDGKDILLCRPADSRDLAEKILRLANDAELRSHIASGGYTTYTSYATPFLIGSQLLDSLRHVQG